MSEAKVH